MGKILLYPGLNQLKHSIALTTRNDSGIGLGPSSLRWILLEKVPLRLLAKRPVKGMSFDGYDAKMKDLLLLQSSCHQEVGQFQNGARETEEKEKALETAHE